MKRVRSGAATIVAFWSVACTMTRPSDAHDPREGSGQEPAHSIVGEYRERFASEAGIDLRLFEPGFLTDEELMAIGLVEASYSVDSETRFVPMSRAPLVHSGEALSTEDVFAFITSGIDAFIEQGTRDGVLAASRVASLGGKEPRGTFLNRSLSTLIATSGPLQFRGTMMHTRSSTKWHEITLFIEVQVARGSDLDHCFWRMTPSVVATRDGETHQLDVRSFDRVRRFYSDLGRALTVTVSESDYSR